MRPYPLSRMSFTNASFCDTLLNFILSDNLYAQGKIDAKVVGIQFAPSSGDSEGSLSFGEGVKRIPYSGKG